MGFLVLLLGHGPLFGLGTPTLAQGAVEVDVCAMTHVTPAASAVMLSGMLAYGVTPNLQLSLAAPLHLHELDDVGPPLLRGAGTMPGDASVEALVGWRFLHWQPGVAQRIEATAFAGGGASLTDERPKALAAIAAGLVTRSVDLWAGGGYEAGGQRSFGSVALGPRLLRRALDLRLFGELVASEDSAAAGPSALVLVGDFTVSAGALFPLRGGEPTRVALSVGMYVF